MKKPTIYRHLCLSCKEEFDYEEKKERCLVCDKKFDDVVRYLLVHSLGRFNTFSCKNCKIRFENPELSCNCPECGLKAIYFGYIWKCGRPTGLIKSLLY